LIVLFCLVFLVTWARERSDERWVEYLSSDQGLQFVFERICADPRIMARNPPRFTLGELTAEISKKDVQAILSPIFGRRLDIRYLGQLSTLMMGRLADKKVIKHLDSMTIESWFEITAKNEHAEKLDRTITS
jgi:hypothetical protein